MNEHARLSRNLLLHAQIQIKKNVTITKNEEERHKELVLVKKSSPFNNLVWTQTICDF